MSLKATMGGALARGLLTVERMVLGTATSPNLSPVRSVLILEYMLPLGCCVHLTPVYQAIKKSNPSIIITVATRGLGVKLLRHHRWLDHVIETPDALVDTISASRFLRKALRSRGLAPDCVLTGGSDKRSRIALLAMLSGVGWRGGYTLIPQFYQKPLEYDWKRSLIDNNLQLAGLAGGVTTHLEPEVFFCAADVEAASQLLQVANPTGKPLLILVTQTSGGQRTGWHESRFTDLVRHATENLGFLVVYVGTAADVPAIEALRREAGERGVSVAGKTSVTQLAALLAMSDCVVSLDTGTMHVGRAVGVPMVVIGPSWQKPIEWLPLGIAQVRILRGADRADIPEGYRLDEVSAGDAMQAVEQLMATYPPSPTNRAERVARGLSFVDHLEQVSAE